MSTTNFEDGRTPIVASWLNDVDTHVYNQDANPHPQYTLDTDLAASSGSSLVGYQPSGTGSVATDVQSKLRSLELADYAALRTFTGEVSHVQIVADGIAGLFMYDESDTTSADNGGTIIVDSSGRRWKRVYSGPLKAKWFVGDAADATAGLLKLFSFAIPRALPFVLEGNYTVNGPLSTIAEIESGSLHIICDGNVSITVDAGSTAFSHLIYCESTAANNASIVGGQLSIDLSNKCGSGIVVRHNAASQGGVVNFDARVSVINAKNNDAASTAENQGILIYGDYQSITVNQAFVKGVTRTNTAAGACKGISIGAFSGEVVVNQPHVENVLVPSAGSTDADGITVFGKAIGTTYNKRAGRAVISDPVLIDCQGRSVKSQCSETTVVRPRVKRKGYVSIAQGVEFDFQFGNGLVIEPEYEYLLNGATSPLGSSHSCISFQQLLDNAPMMGKSIGGVLRTEVLVPRYAVAAHNATSAYSETEVSGLRVIPLGALATTAIDRAILESRMDTVLSKPAKTKLTVRDISGPVGCPQIGYTNYSSGSLAAKLNWEVTDVKNSLGPSSAAKPFHALSGSVVTEVESFLMRNNLGIRDFQPMSVYDMQKLVPGCVFTTDIANSTVSHAPSWGTSGYATVECVGAYFGTTDRSIRVTKDNATAANSVFWTRDGGTTWGTIK